MKNLLLALTTFFLSPLFSLAQTNFKPGYIVNLKGDTTKGFVDYKDWTKNPKDVYFKSDNSVTPKTYNAKDIAAFAVTGIEYYRSYTGKISQDRVEISNPLGGIDTTYIIDDVFLRALSSGTNVTLFDYKDNIKERYFIAEKNGLPTELTYHSYLSRGELTKVADNKYRQQLQLLRTIYQPNNAGLVNDIQTTNYNQKSLLKIAKELNGGTDDLLMINKSKNAVRFFTGAGINAGTINFKDKGADLQSSSTNIAPIITVGLDLLFNKNVGNFFLRTELTYASTKTKLAFGDGSAPSAFSTTNIIMFDRHAISLSPQFIYNVFNKQKFKLYAGGGLVLILSAFNNQQTYREYNNTKISSSYSLRSLLPVNVTLVAKTGVMINSKIDIHLTYQPPVAINSETTQYVLKGSALRAGVSYLF